MISTLALDITNNGDCSNFRIKDSSYYNPNLPITCVHLAILPPTAKVPVEFEVSPYFDSVFNTANLKIQTAVNDCLTSLPDGIYYIKYSINPNDRIYVEYNYLHNCNQYSKFIENVCKTMSNKCNFTKLEYHEKIEEIQHIKTLIDSSKYLVEYCDNPEEGMRLYDEVNNLLNSYKHDAICKNCK
jgi:hypothetical protein